MEYTIVESWGEEANQTYRKSKDPVCDLLVEKVNKMIAVGWKPIGGVAVRSMVMYQAMIKE